MANTAPRKREPKSSERVKPVLQLKVRGPGVRSGRIPVPDLIKICQEAQNTINKQAEALEGRKTIHPGPIANLISDECTLELVGIRKGSTTLQFEFVKPQMPLDLAADSFGLEAISEVVQL